MIPVSVILPVYNVEKYLERCLNSILGQTYTNFELICVNDGSTDSSREILARFASRDSRIRIIDQANAGLPAARNAALTVASGEYVYFLDSDDAMHPQLLEIALMYAKKEKADIVCFNTQRSDGVSFDPKTIDQPQNIAFTTTNKPLFLCRKKAKIRISYNVWTKFYRRAVLETQPFINGIIHEDWPFIWSLMVKSPKTTVLQAVLHYYTINPNSISHAKINAHSLESFAIGLKAVCILYRNSAKNERTFMQRTLVSNILKHMYRQYRLATSDLKPELERILADLLITLDKSGDLHFQGHHLWHYIAYRHLIAKYSKQ